MNFPIQQIRIEKLQLINLSPKWIRFIQFIQAHPFVTFKSLKFVNGEPDWAVTPLTPPETEAIVEESLKF